MEAPVVVQTPVDGAVEPDVEPEVEPDPPAEGAGALGAAAEEPEDPDGVSELPLGGAEPLGGDEELEAPGAGAGAALLPDGAAEPLEPLPALAWVSAPGEAPDDALVEGGAAAGLDAAGELPLDPEDPLGEGEPAEAGPEPEPEPELELPDEEDEPPDAAPHFGPVGGTKGPEPSFSRDEPGLGNWRSPPSSVLQSVVGTLATNMSGKEVSRALNSGMANSSVSFSEASRLLEPPVTFTEAQFMYISRLPTLLNLQHVSKSV